MNPNERKERKLQCATRSVLLVKELLEDHKDVIGDLVYELDKECQHKLETGRDDLYGSIVNLRIKFDEFWPQKFASLDENDQEDSILKSTVFDRLLSDLHYRGDLVLVGDRQRARSRAFEVVHYLRRLKQRTTAREKEGVEPELVDMLKVEVRRRERPRREVTIEELMEGLNEELSSDELIDLQEEWESYLKVPDDLDFDEIIEFSMKCFELFLQSAFGEKGTFSVFQKEAFYTLLKDAFKDSPKTGRVIAAGTGFGKTEAFLLPLLFYSISVWYVREKRKSNGERVKSSCSGLLLYPRIDLCNNQAERLLRYVAELNEVLEREWDGDKTTPLRIAVAHSGLKRVRIQCPLCVKELHKENKQELDRAYIVPDIDEDAYGKPVVGFKCQRNSEHAKVAELLIPQIMKSTLEPADFGITTVDTLHRRLMDDHGQQKLFNKNLLPPRFIVVDEMHIYEGQAGSHVAHILRRCRQRIRRMKDDAWNPVFVGASATAGDPIDLAFRMFGAPKTDDRQIKPQTEDKIKSGLEYFFFLQSPGNRVVESEDVADATQDGALEDEEGGSFFVSEQATMIQAAMCLSHTIKRPSGVSGQKRRTLGFIDSIDVATRLGRNLDDAEWQQIRDGNRIPLPLYALRFPVGIPNAVDSFDQQIREVARNLEPPDDDSRFQLPILGCNRFSEGNCVQPPHALLERCERYERGECWHAMVRESNEGSLPLSIQVHKSGSRKWGNPDNRLLPEDRDNWRLLVSTSALEVGFDHPELIATWQYHAPPSIASFVQRKGRGGRGITDFPITMVVLGKSFGDVYRFQDHLKLVDVDDEDIASVLDETNPSIRQQHLFSAVLDFCANSTEFRGAFRIKNIEKIVDACDSPKCSVWLQECFDMKRNAVELFIEELKSSVLQVWNKTLNFDALPSPPSSSFGTKPVDLFKCAQDELTEWITTLKLAPGCDLRTLLWMRTAHKAIVDSDYKVTSIVDFCRFLPQDFINDDIYVPSTTIPVPIGRYVNVEDTDGRHKAVEPAEFGLKNFLPGGFKIRYEKLWMAPWHDVPSKPREPDSSRVWVGTQESIKTRNTQSIEKVLQNSNMDSQQKRQVSELLGNDCIIGEVETLKLQDLGSPRTRSFSMESSTLRIVTSRPPDANKEDYRLLARDPHIVPKFTYITESNDFKSNVVLGNKLPFMTESKIRFYDRFKLTICFYANLVNCYPKEGDPETVVVRFWDEKEDKPIAPSIKMQTQALEFRFNNILDLHIDPVAKYKIFWERFEELLLEKMVIESGLLRSVYLVPKVAEALRLVEPATPFCIAYSKEQIEIGLQHISVTRFVSQEILDWCILQIDRLAYLIEECRDWCESIGIQRTAIDSLGAALSRVAAKTINVSPTMFRRKSFFTEDGLRVILFDDVEGGSGNTRRLRDDWHGEANLKDDLLKQVNCSASEVDSIIFAAFDAGLSPEALSKIALSGDLLDSWTNGKQKYSVARAKPRLQKFAKDANIAAFNMFVRKQWRNLSEELGRPPTWLRLLGRIMDTSSLDIRAENLKRNFEDKKHGAPNELRSRVKEMMPLCESACPECLTGEMYSEREYVNREVLASFLSLEGGA